MKRLRTTIAILLLVSMFAGFVPTDLFGTAARAEAPDPAVVVADEFAGLPEQAAELAARGAVLESEGWR